VRRFSSTAAQLHNLVKGNKTECAPKVFHSVIHGHANKWLLKKQGMTHPIDLLLKYEKQMKPKADLFYTIFQKLATFSLTLI
jgi:hypothetical protein